MRFEKFCKEQSKPIIAITLLNNKLLINLKYEFIFKPHQMLSFTVCCTFSVVMYSFEHTDSKQRLVSLDITEATEIFYIITEKKK